ncbi:MAG: NAD(P)H-dependent glycerol-3-phosphate dehydrogenase [Rickettsiales bacterium]|nr:MAG: NAD(P)H-dependent glycerol-3-phosphate dehydrogenase [Rickettsiales bacterium]
MTKEISVIGAGAWGSALAYVISGNSKVLLYKRDCVESSDHRINYTNNIEDALDNQNILIVVPAQKVRDIIGTFDRKIENRNIIICSKGIENHTQKFMSEVISEIIPNNNIFVLSGPNFAKDVINDLPSASLLAGNNIDSANHLARLLSSDNFSIYPSDDIIGTQICGAVKNIIAIACGVSVGLRLGDNIKAAIISFGILEMQSIIHVYGGREETLNSIAGIGDLTLTCNSSQSRNLQYGIDSVVNRKYDNNATIEGIYSSISINNIMKKHSLNLPICKFVYDYLSNKIDSSDIRFIIKNNIS